MSKGVLCSPRTDAQTDRHTDRQTDTKVNTEGTLSGFQDFFLQPIIKDRPNKYDKCLVKSIISNKQPMNSATLLSTCFCFF